MSQPQKVAIVHDWLVGGGAELVVEELHRMFPNAPIYTSYCTDEWRKRLNNKVVTGWLQHWPFSALYKFLPVLRIWWFTHLDLSDYDLVISSSGNGEAKGIKVGKWKTENGKKVFKKPLHLCYCHSPTHFYWRHYQEYLKHPKSGFLNPLARLGLKVLVKPLRVWDKKAAQRPDFFIANSSHIQSDIKKYYGRDSIVIHPPVNTERFGKWKMENGKWKSTGFVTVGRQVPYKKVDIIVDACSKLNVPLTVIGKGPDHKKLVQRAGPTVRFLDNASDDEVVEQMAKAEAFIFAAFDDFGITPVEALSAGTPVIAYKAGGALDYVIEGKTGEFFDHQTVASLMKTLRQFDSSKYTTAHMKTVARTFDKSEFRRKIENYIKEVQRNHE